MISEKLRVLDEVNKKLVNFQNMLKIKLLYDNGDDGSFNVLIDENVWVQDEKFGIGSRYKTLNQYNKGDISLHPVLFEGKSGNVVDTHTHKESHLFICVDGNIKVTLDRYEIYNLEGHDTLYVHSEQPHKFEFICDSKLLILLLSE